jgi:hypothetical protein
MNTSITRFPFLAAATAVCVLTCSVSRVSSAVSNPPPNCDGSAPGTPKLCLGAIDGGLQCEGRSPRDCQASIGIKNIQIFPIDTVVSKAPCKTSLAAAKSEKCAEQWWCVWNAKTASCQASTQVLGADKNAVYVYVPAYSSADCAAVGCNQ